jgi:hypothetical protein
MQIVSRNGVFGGLGAAHTFSIRLASAPVTARRLQVQHGLGASGS